MIYHVDYLVPHRAGFQAAYDALPKLGVWNHEYTEVKHGLETILGDIDIFERFGNVSRLGDLAHVCRIPDGRWGYHNTVVPTDELFLIIRFSTGAYYFGQDYDTELFDEFFSALVGETSPRIIDEHNHALVFNEADSKQAVECCHKLIKEYEEKHRGRAKDRRRRQLEQELQKIKEDLTDD